MLLTERLTLNHFGADFGVGDCDLDDDCDGECDLVDHGDGDCDLDDHSSFGGKWQDR